MSIARLFKNTRNRRVVLVLILLAMAGQFMRTSFGTLSIVEGVSMSPTFQPDDVVQAKTVYAEAQRGDIVIVMDAQGERVIKRIVGLPGEKLVLYRGFIYINSRRLDEPYLPKHTYTYKSSERNENPEVWQLGNQEYFVLGDNRFQSTDSRHYGPVTRPQILSVVNAPANVVHPGFSAVTLSESGEVMLGRYAGYHDRN